MASKLVPCKLCKKEISSNASKCPHCGEKSPVIEKVGIIGKIIGITFWGFIGLSILGAIFSSNNTSTTSSTPVQPQVKTEEQVYQVNCRQNWNKCKNNADIVNLNAEVDTDMKLKCKWASEKQSKFDIEWGSWSPFGAYNRGNSALTDGKILMVDTDAKYHNAFGGKVKTTTNCLFNLKTMTVEEVSIE